MKTISDRSIRITVDVENISGSITDPEFARSLDPLLLELDQTNTKATFFIVGSLARVWKKEIRSLALSGHEIALHGHTHEYLAKLGPKKFSQDLIDGKNIIEDVVGQQVIGFRAPYFSLTKESLWAPELLLENGFRFSSSVLPAWNPQAGFPGAPRTPFLWKCGLVEFPVPTFGIGPCRLPLLGGAYLRLVPNAVFQIARLIGSNRIGEWAYCHPYDFDVDAKFEKVRDSSWVFSKLLFARRKLMLSRIKDLSKLGANDSFQIRIENREYLASLSVYEYGGNSASEK